MKTGPALLLAVTLWLAASGAWAAEVAAAPAPPVAPSTITMACFSNSCGAALAAAIKDGDVRAVLDAGGSAADVVAAMSARGSGPTINGRRLIEIMAPEDAQFVATPQGGLGVRVKTGNAVMVISRSDFGQAPAGTSSLGEDDGNLPPLPAGMPGAEVSYTRLGEARMSIAPIPPPPPP